MPWEIGLRKYDPYHYVIKSCTLNTQFYDHNGIYNASLSNDILHAHSNSHRQFYGNLKMHCLGKLSIKKNIKSCGTSHKGGGVNPISTQKIWEKNVFFNLVHNEPEKPL